MRADEFLSSLEPTKKRVTADDFLASLGEKSFSADEFLQSLTPEKPYKYSSESFRPAPESFKSTLGQIDERETRLQKPFNLRPDQTVRPPPGPFALQPPYAKLPEIAGKAILKAPLSYAKGLGGQIQKVQELPLPGGASEREGEPFLSGKMIADYWDEKLKKLQPNVKPDSPEAYADMMLTSVAQNVPLIVASSLGLSMPAAIKKLGLTAAAINNLGLAGMGLTAGGTKYVDIRKVGVPAEKARLVSDIVGISEAGTEKLGFDKLMKPGLRFAKRLVLSAGLDVPGELINTAVESALDKVTINKEMTWTDLGKSLADTAIVALGSAGLVTAIAHPLIAVPEAMKRDEQNIKTKAAVDKYVAESMPSIREQIPKFGATTDKAPTIDFPLFTPTTPQIQPEAIKRPVADATIAPEAGEAERIRVEEAKATLLKNITEKGAGGIGYTTVDGKLSAIEGSAGGAFVKTKEGGALVRDTHLNVELTKEQKKRFAVLEADVTFAETPEERMASKKAMADFLLPIAKDILGTKTLLGDISEQRPLITKPGVPAAQQTVSKYPKAQLDEMADILRREAVQNYEIVKSDDLLDKINKAGKINNRFFKGKEETKTIRPYVKMKAFTAETTAGDMDEVAGMLGMTDVELLNALNAYQPISKPSEKLSDYHMEAEHVLEQMQNMPATGQRPEPGLSDYEPGVAESVTGYGVKEQGKLFDVPKESIQQRYDRYKKIAKEQGFDQLEQERYAKGELAKEVKAKPGVPAAIKPVQTEFKGKGIAKFGEDTTGMLPFDENKIAETLAEYGNPPHNEVTIKQAKILQAINPDRPTLLNFFTSNKQNGADLRVMVSNAMKEGISDEQLIPQVKELLGVSEAAANAATDQYRQTVESVESRAKTEAKTSPYDPQIKSIEKAIVAMTEQGERIEKLAEAIQAKTEGKVIEGNVLPKLSEGEKVEEAAAKYTSPEMLVSTEPTINTKKDMQITDISGNKVSIPAGTAIMPRLIKGGKYVITTDTDDYVLSKNQYENLKGQSVKGEAKEFAPELEKTEEVIKKEESGAKFSRHIPEGMFGGRNYREVLVSAPVTKFSKEKSWIMYNVNGKIIGHPLGGNTEEKAIKQFNVYYGEERGEAVRAERETIEFEEADFQSPHWGEPNVLFHNRFADFTTPDGEKAVVWIEGQSDWAKSVREKKDYLSKQYPDSSDFREKQLSETGHPLLKNWQTLAAKRALIEAVNSNADYLALVTGEQVADIYDLSKQVDKVVYSKNDDGTYSIGYIQKGLERVDADERMTNIKENEIQNIVGKNIAEKIINGEGVPRKTNEKLKELQGNDLKVGGEWAKTLYDRQFPNILKDLTGAEIEIIKLKNKSGLSPLSQPAFRITPEIRAIVKGEAPQLRQPSRVSPFTIKEGQSTYYADLFPETKAKPKPGLPAEQPGEAEITGSPMAYKLKQTGSLLMANETLRDPTDVAFMIDTLHGEAIETYFIGALDGNDKPLGVMYVGIGSIRSGEVNTYDVVTILNKLGAKRFFTGHNHPGGNMSFSDEDMRLTKKLKLEMGKLGFEFTGHVLWDHQKVVGYLDADLKYTRVSIPQAVTVKGEVKIFKGYQEWLDGKSAEDLPALNGPTKVFEVLKNIQTDTEGNLVVIYMNNQLKNMGVEIIPNKEYSVARIIKNATAVRANNVIVGGSESMEISSTELKNGLAKHEIKLRDIISIMPEGKFSSAKYDGFLAEEEVKYGEEDLPGEWPKKEPRVRSEGELKHIAGLIKLNIPLSKKINLLDYFRTPEYVFKKMGMEKEADLIRKGYDAYQKEIPGNIEEITNWSKRVKGEESNKKIFQFLDGKIVELNPEELKVAKEIKAKLESWADRLNIPKERRISNYITHLFSDQLISKEFDQDLAKIITDRIARTVYDPFLLKRKGVEGYKEDVWAALDAYTKRATRKAHIDPALEALKRIEYRMELSQWKYIKSYIDHMNMRPTDLDNLLDNGIKQIIGYRLGGRPTTVITRFLRQMTYRAKLGVNVSSTLRNLSQGINTYAKLGEKYTIIGYAKLLNPNNHIELEQEGVLKSSFIEDRQLNAIKRTMEKIDKILFFLFEMAERINRGAAYFGAKSKALAQGKTEIEAKEYGKKIVRETQFLFSSIDTPVAFQSDIAKTIIQLKTYNIKQLEFLTTMAKNKEFLGLVRYIVSGLAFIYTIGRLFGMAWDEIFPATAMGTPVSLKLPETVIREGFNIPDKYGKTRDTEARLQSVNKEILLSLPASSQIKKAYEGMKAIEKGGVYDKGDKLKFKVGLSNYSKMQALLFGKYASPEAQEYFDKKSLPPLTEEEKTEKKRLRAKQSGKRVESEVRTKKYKPGLPKRPR